VWRAAAIGVLARTADAAQGITFLISFLAYPSSAFVPVHTMPGFLQTFAANQPVSQIADAMRALLDNAPVGAAVWHAVVWSLAITVASIVLAGALYRRRAH
jgi:ABC-2 type transport system permease protein